ncbi:hypothetical protein [uncultured Clostridium sp.]|uniref:hypothetical protein n=1 Tax=uncultured Clostridium sp. TaxID=59620 RepID=UPI0025EA2F9D|nr:hypothetical protein [uncultured Clostridium sp.]
MEVIKLGTILTLGIIGAFIIFGFIIEGLNRLSRKSIYKAFGKPVLYLTCFIGTPVHEFGHYIMCKLFLHRVIEVKWFIPSAVECGGVLGYVRHSRKNSLYQRIGDFFIGIGPLIVGSIIIIALFNLLLPDTWELLIKMDGLELKEVFKAIFSAYNMKNYKFWLFIVFSISISSHMSLSKMDIENSYFGAIMLFIINMIIAFNIINLNLNTDGIFKVLYNYNLVCITLMSVGVISIILAITISNVVLGIKHLVRI